MRGGVAMKIFKVDREQCHSQYTLYKIEKIRNANSEHSRSKLHRTCQGMHDLRSSKASRDHIGLTILSYTHTPF